MALSGSNSSWESPEIREYWHAHQESIVSVLGDAVNLVFHERPPNPIQFVGRHLVEHSGAYAGPSDLQAEVGRLRARNESLVTENERLTTALAQASAARPEANAEQADQFVKSMRAVRTIQAAEEYIRQLEEKLAASVTASSAPTLLPETLPVAPLSRTVTDGAAEQSDHAAPLPLLPEEAEGGSSDAWSLDSWAKSAGVHRAVAAALHAPLAGKQKVDEPDAVLEFVKSLASREEVHRLLSTRGFTSCLVDLVWGEVRTLQTAGAATSKDLESKFAGAIELSYSGLDTFFGGLEGIVGSPSPKVFEGMENDHLHGPGSESHDTFVTGNYGVETCSKVEWQFVAEPKATPETLGLSGWPKESEQKLPDRDRCRKRVSLEQLLEAAKERNAQLLKAKQPEVMKEEIVAANLYTGPMFVKYNGVLRGLRSEAAFLRNSMITLCCPKAVADGYVAKTIGFEAATQSLNRYTTTLHAINSAIIKLGKLTKACKIYRGIAGMKLPDEFWTPNEFGVRGGVEQAFMSTTTEQSVAMGYAAGGKGAGIVIEVQQGMVDRGADISWLSQYPHEREILCARFLLRTRRVPSVCISTRAYPDSCCARSRAALGHSPASRCCARASTARSS